MPDSVPKLDAPLAVLLHRLRRQIRRYVWTEGLAAAVVWLGLAFWIGLALDWWLEPPAAVRAVGLAVVAIVLAGVLYRYVLRRALVPLRDSSLALLLERRFRGFEDSLVTTVELAEKFRSADDFHPEMLDQARRKSVAQAKHVDVRAVFQRRPLVTKLAAAGVAVLSIALFAVFASSAMATWIDRGLLLSDALWPRKTRLLIDGFEDGIVKVARGSDLQIVVKADTSKELIPDNVRIRYILEDTTRTDLMTRVGEAQPPKDAFQQFNFTFKSILAPIAFEVRGGDDRIRNLHIEPVESPLITDMVLHVDYPQYTQRGSREDRVTGIMQAPVGSSVRITGRATKDLAEITIHRLQGEKTDLLGKVDMRSAADPALLDHSMGRVDGDQTLLLDLLDQDGIRSRDPVRLVLSAVPDEPPKVAVRLRSIGQAITPEAVLPLVGEITDDYGLAQVWFEYRIDEGHPTRHEIRKPDSAQQLDSLEFDQESDAALDTRDLKLTLGQKLLIAVKALDTYALGKEANSASSETYSLDVVTASQLLAMLEARELMLRRRLESTIELVTRMRDSLTGMKFDQKPVPGSATDQAVSEAASPLAVRSVEIRRAVSDTKHSAQESLSLSDAFIDIHQELTNNRLDITEKRTRLLDGISAPLKRIGDEDLPELESRLNRLLAAADSTASGPDRLSEVLSQCDATLVALNGVLEQMLKLEDFNQLVEMLRGVIEAQDDLNAQTAKRNKEKARDLLE